MKSHHLLPISPNKLTFGITCLLLLFGATASRAAQLKPETVKAWDEYILSANAKMKERLGTNSRFLWLDENPEWGRRVRAGEIVVAPMGVHNPRKVPSGLIHHWMGAAFIPNTKLDGVFGVVRDYGRYKELYRPSVIDSRPVSQVGTEDKFSMLLMNKALVLKFALDSDYESSYVPVNQRRWYSVAYTTRIQEIEDYGQSSEHKLPAGEGSGFIWRLYSTTRFEERDGGVYVELEAIALSRDIPASLRWLVEPVVRRVSKSSLLTSLTQTREAVLSTATWANAATKAPITTAASCSGSGCVQLGPPGPGLIRSFH